jgi:DNA-binding CsgD family transcriptional regulator
VWDKLLDAIYEAPLRSHRWSEVLVLTRQLLHDGELSLYCLSDRQLPDWFSPAIPSWFKQACLEHQRYLQHWNNPDLAQCCPLVFCIDNNGMSAPTLTEKPYELKTLKLNPHRFIYLSIHGSDGLTPPTVLCFYAEHDALNNELEASIKLIHQHLHRALRLCWHWQQHLYSQQIYINALEVLGSAVLLLDQQLQIVYSNRAANDVLQQRDGLSVQNRQLTVASASTRQALQLVFTRALHTQHSGMLGLVRPSGKHPFQLTVQALPAQGELRHSMPSARLMLVIVDPQALLETDIDELTMIHGLTPAEARVCVKLLAGNNLKRCATTLDISYETVRSHIKSVYRKLSVHTQAELLNILRAGH